MLLSEGEALASYLSHGCQETLRVKEARHPEAVGTPLKDPRLELSVPLQQLCEPEPQGAGGPRRLEHRPQVHAQTCSLMHRRAKARNSIVSSRTARATSTF